MFLGFYFYCPYRTVVTSTVKMLSLFMHFLSVIWSQVKQNAFKFLIPIHEIYVLELYCMKASNVFDTYASEMLSQSRWTFWLKFRSCMVLGICRIIKVKRPNTEIMWAYLYHIVLLCLLCMQHSKGILLCSYCSLFIFSLQTLFVSPFMSCWLIGCWKSFIEQVI